MTPPTARVAELAQAPLVTLDGKLAMAQGPFCEIRVFGAIDRLTSAPSVQIVGEGPASWAAHRGIEIGQAIRGNDVPVAAIMTWMRAHGVSTIYTGNRGFRRFDGIRVIDPFG